MLYSYKLYPPSCINLNIAVAHGDRSERGIGILFLQVKKKLEKSRSVIVQSRSTIKWQNLS